MAAIVIVAAFTLGTIMLVQKVADTAVGESRMFHAGVLVATVVADYLETKGRWPCDWQDLESVRPRSQGDWSWPEDRVALEESVYVDFLTSVEDVAVQHPDEFSAVFVRGSAFRVNRFIAEHLIEAAAATSRRQ
jgi:hypothetical protein